MVQLGIRSNPSGGLRLTVSEHRYHAAPQRARQAPAASPPDVQGSVTEKLAFSGLAVAQERDSTQLAVRRTVVPCRSTFVDQCEHISCIDLLLEWKKIFCIKIVTHTTP